MLYHKKTIRLTKKFIFSIIITILFITIEKQVPVAVPHPVPVAVPVPQPYPVIKTKTVAVPVDRPYPVKVPVKVPYPVPAPYPVKVNELNVSLKKNEKNKKIQNYCLFFNFFHFLGYTRNFSIDYSVRIFISTFIYNFLELCRTSKWILFVFVCRSPFPTRFQSPFHTPSSLRRPFRFTLRVTTVTDLTEDTELTEAVTDTTEVIFIKKPRVLSIAILQQTSVQ